jgi:peroxiredoxin
MRLRFWIAIIVAGILIGMSAHYYLTRLGKGDSAPNFTLPDISGTEHSLEDYRGKPVIVHFWATWCDTCLTEIPALQSFYSRNKDKGIVVLGILEDEAPDKLSLNFPVLLDKDGLVANSYDSFGVPETFFVDSEGTVVRRVSGPVDWLKEEL